MQLKPYHPDFFGELQSAIAEQSDCLLWAGPVFDWPLSEVEFNRHLSADEILPLLCFDGKALVGYAELVRIKKKKFKICRVLIFPQQRNKGYGKKMMRELIQYGIENSKAKQFHLSVYEHNEQAVAMYQALGFTVTSVELCQDLPIPYNQWSRLKMSLQIHD